VKGEYRLMLKDAKNFDISFVGSNHELLHVVSECDPIDLTIYVHELEMTALLTYCVPRRS
jgi:hypothetical protein